MDRLDGGPLASLASRRPVALPMLTAYVPPARRTALCSPLFPEPPVAWTIGTTADQADQTARRDNPALRLAITVLIVALVVLSIFGQPWALSAALGLLGARLLLGAAAEFRAARPPAGGPSFAIATLREGPVEVVGRVLPPERGLLSPLTSTKCSYYDYVVEVLDEASGERRVVDQGTKLTDFWLK